MVVKDSASVTSDQASAISFKHIPAPSKKHDPLPSAEMTAELANDSVARAGGAGSKSKEVSTLDSVLRQEKRRHTMVGRFPDNDDN